MYTVRGRYMNMYRYLYISLVLSFFTVYLDKLGEDDYKEELKLDIQKRGYDIQEFVSIKEEKQIGGIVSKHKQGLINARM